MAMRELIRNERVSKLWAVHPEGLLQGIHTWVALPLGGEEVLGCE